MSDFRIPEVGLGSFPERLDACVVGAFGGIGRAFVEALSACPRVGSVLALSRSGEDPGLPKVSAGKCDLEDEASLAAAAELAEERTGKLELVIVASGVLHAEGIRPERSYKQLAPEAFAKLFAVNATGPALVGKHFLPLLPREGKSCFAAISARVGSIQDNGIGGWHAYRASKAALNQVLRCFAIELARRNKGAVVAGLHPGTTDTALSEPFQANVADHKLFPPAYSAAMMLGVLDELKPEGSGNLYAYDGERVPF